jgi:hypothetical protein
MKKHLVFLCMLLLTCAMSTQVYAAGVLQEVSSSENLAKGTVVDENGQPIVGVFVQELGTTKGTVTDADGNFSLEVGSNAKLQFSFLGYKTVVTKPEGNMRIVMKEDNAQLDEVVVVGYGAQKKANLTGAVSTVDLDKTLTSRPEQDVTKALQGAVPGLTVLNSPVVISTQSLHCVFAVLEL